MSFPLRLGFTLFAISGILLSSITLADPDGNNTTTTTTTRCSFDKIAQDVKQISTNTLALDEHVKNVNHGSQAKQVVALVHNDFRGITKAIDTTADDMKPCHAPLPNDVFERLISSVKTIIKEENRTMTDLVVQKPVFDALKGGDVSSVIKKDLGTLHSSSVVLENIWVSKAPYQLKEKAKKLVDEINNVLAFAQAAYAYA
ncbi:hypothetical protein L218DRAFT_1067933 [Marasmius fiardii PR-910]|nr:hypothetical protein L218DRAFT_1067933 [Marasmius fiardii PR-910]